MRTTSSSILRAPLVGLFLALLGLTAVTARADDNEVTAQMRSKIEALRQKLAATNDAREQAALKKEVTQLIDDSLAQISESARPMMAVMLKVVTPLQTDNSAYTRAAAAFFNSPNAALETIKSRDDIAARTKALTTLAEANTRLLLRLDSLNSDVASALGESRMTPTERMAIRSTLVQQFYPTRNLRDLESKIYLGYRSAMAMLDREWGHWHVNADGVLVWDEPANAEKFKVITDEIQSLADTQMTAQLKLSTTR